MYTTNCTRQLYFLFLSCLSLFSSTISHCIRTSTSSVLLYTFQYTVLFFSLCISVCFTIYHGIRASTVSLFAQFGEPHDPHREELTRILRARDIDFSQGLEICLQYSLKIAIRNSREVAEHTTLERTRKQRPREKK
jgi:hypothetical protein